MTHQPIKNARVKILLAVCAGLVLAAPLQSGAVSYSEGVSGDLSDISGTPTSLGIFAPGLHSVSGQVGSGGDNNDNFTFDLTGQLEDVQLTFTAGSGNTFIGIYAHFFVVPGAQIGDGFFNASDLNMSPFNGLDPFAGGPLQPGAYSMNLSGTQGRGYTLAFTVGQPVPLPAALLLFAPALVALRVRRQK